MPVSSRIVIRILAAITGFGALSSLVGAVLAVGANGGGVPIEHLAGSPFSSYAVPGLILGLVVGGTQLVAAIALLARRRAALWLSAVAGFGMLIWIFAELSIILRYSWLQAVYFGLGALELIFVFALLGIAPAFVAPLPRSDQRSPKGPRTHV